MIDYIYLLDNNNVIHFAFFFCEHTKHIEIDFHLVWHHLNACTLLLISVNLKIILLIVSRKLILLIIFMVSQFKLVSSLPL